MSGIGYKLTIDDLQVRQYLQGMLARDANPGPALHDIGIHQMRSTHKNFAQGGRPEAWAPLRPSTLRHKEKTGHTKILIDDRILENSITTEVQDDTLVEGTAVPYGRIHQLGGEIKRTARRQVLAFNKGRFYSRKKASMRKRGSINVRIANVGAHTIKIPARKYMVWLGEDLKVYGKICASYVLKGKTLA